MEKVTGIWDDSDLFARYRVTLRFIDKVMGAIPNDPKLIESWLYGKITGGDEALKQAIIETLESIGVDVPAEATPDEIMELARQLAAIKKGCTFRRNGEGLYIEDYRVKRMMAEATNILFPWGSEASKWGMTKKGAEKFFAETLFVDEHNLPLGRDREDGTYLHVGHPEVKGKRQATLTYYDYCTQAEVTVTLSLVNDAAKWITDDRLTAILKLGQRLGMGAMRKYGHGQFKVTAFDRV